MKALLLVFAVILKISLCRDFYVGMFKQNDILVAQDTLYKEKRMYGFATAKYGRIFHCPITYFRISDRLGVGRPPSVKITRGGIMKKYLTIVLTSAYNMPIAVNIYIGCANTITTPKTAANATAAETAKKESGKKEEVKKEGKKEAVKKQGQKEEVNKGGQKEEVKKEGQMEEEKEEDEKEATKNEAPGAESATVQGEAPTPADGVDDNTNPDAATDENPGETAATTQIPDN